MRTRTSTLPMLLSAALAACGAPPSPPLEARVDALLAEQIDAGGPGCAVGVARGGAVLYTRGYGLANLDHGVAITPDTVFDVGSVTKQFTAASSVLLALDGALSLDDDIRRYLPELPDYGDVITVEHLLHHTSGVRDYLNLMALGGREFYAPISHQDIVELMARQRALNRSPGERYSYSNTGYMLLATIVERVSGQTFGTFARERLFEPLGMTASFLYEDAGQVVRHRATGYAPEADDGGYRMVHNFSFATAGDGQLYTTVGDLLRWSHAFTTDEVAGADFTAIMLAPGRLADGEATTYGAGLALGGYRGLTTNGHGGSTWGFRAQVVRVPDHELSVAVLCNREDTSPGRLVNGIVDLYLEDHLEPAPEPRRPRPRRGPRDQLAPAPTRFVPEDYAGSFYSEELDARYHIRADDAALGVRIERWPPLALIPTTDADRFTGLDFPAWTGPRRVELVFRRDARGAVIGFALSAGQARGIEFVRLPDQSP